MADPCKVLLPRQLTPQAALGISLKLRDSEPFSTLVFDFQNTEWLEPFSMLYFSGLLKNYRINHDVKVFVQNFSKLDYGKHMGFFSACGANVGKKVGQALGSETYLPISDIIFNSPSRIETTRPTIVQEIIEEKAIALAEVLLGKHTEQNLVDVISFSIREIGRNVYEHSGADRLSYVAQFWPAKSEVEICISDLGCGIYSSILQNSHLVPQSNLDAIGMCLLPGISCKGNVFEGRSSDHWKNSGFGLYMMASLCALDGSIFVLSNDSGLLIKNGIKHVAIDE